MELFSCTNWNESPETIIEKLKHHAGMLESSLFPKEIERKWLLKSNSIGILCSTFSIIEHATIIQAYLSTNPELRIRSNHLKNGTIEHMIAFKESCNDGLSKEGLNRYEIECNMTKESAFSAAKYIRSIPNIMSKNGNLFIYKDFYVLDIGNGLKLDLSKVDEDSKFIYAEVEFESTEDALTYNLPETIQNIVLKEITYDDSFKMKNYWKRTRLGL